MSKNHLDTAQVARRVVALLLALPLLALSICASAQKPDAEELAKQQQEVMRQYMEAAGMSPEDIARNEALVKGSMAPIVQRQAAEEEREQAEFEARNAGLGKAVISMGGKEAELQITECVTKDNGDWHVKAQDRANSSNSLDITGDVHYRRSLLWMSLKDVGAVEGIGIEPMVPMNDGQVAWAGTVDGSRGETQVSVNVDCEQGS